MNIFGSALPPAHIGLVESESRTLFGHLRGEERKMEKAFGLPFKDIDLGVAWAEFDLISYDTMFRETNGDTELLYEPIVRSRILNKIMQRWPIRYYLKVFEQSGIMQSFDIDTGTVYAFTQAYKDSRKAMSTASDIVSG